MLHWCSAGEGFVDIGTSLVVHVSMTMLDAGRESAACEGGQRQDNCRDAHDGRFQRASKERLRWVVVSRKLDGYLASARSWPAILY